MTLWSETYTALDSATNDGSGVEDEVEAWKLEASDMCLQWSYCIASSMRDFRETYGLKVISNFGIIQQGAAAIFILFRNLRSDPNSRTRADPASCVLDIFESPLSDTTAAFEECFRCTLSAGLQLILPRGIARIIYRMASQANVALPDPVQRMLAIMAETAWQQTDIQNLESVFPTFDIGAPSKNGIISERRMMEALKKWEQLDC